MASTSWKRPNGRDETLSTLNAVIYDLNLAKETTSVTPAKVVLDSASTLLARIRVGIPSVCVYRMLADVHRNR
jgi:hypothetical protein